MGDFDDDFDLFEDCDHRVMTLRCNSTSCDAAVHFLCDQAASLDFSSIADQPLTSEQRSARWSTRERPALGSFLVQVCRRYDGSSSDYFGVGVQRVGPPDPSVPTDRSPLYESLLLKSGLPVALPAAKRPRL